MCKPIEIDFLDFGECAYIPNGDRLDIDIVAGVAKSHGCDVVFGFVSFLFLFLIF